MLWWRRGTFEAMSDNTRMRPNVVWLWVALALAFAGWAVFDLLRHDWTQVACDCAAAIGFSLWPLTETISPRPVSRPRHGAEPTN